MPSSSPRLLVPVTAILLLIGCASDDVRVSTVAREQAVAQPEQRLEPDELAPALEALSQRILVQVTAAAERIDATATGNPVRRETLLWRIRAAEVSAAAANRDNHVVGMIELWFWTMTMAAHFDSGGAGATAFGPGQAEAVVCNRALAGECEQLVQRTVPEKSFPALRERIATAAGKGELFTATATQTRDVLGTLLDATRIEALLSLPLAPFTALKGIGTGGDAVASLVLVAKQGVNLAERYPQLLAWHAQLAVLGVEEQDTVRGVRQDLKRLVDLAESLPTRFRAEGEALLAHAAVHDTLKQAEATALAMAKLADSVEAMLARIQAMNPPPLPGEPVEPASRPFDIREYESTLRAAEATAREAQQAIAAATGAIAKPQMQDAASAAAERLERVTDRIFNRTIIAIGALGGVGAGLLALHHFLRLRRKP